MTEMLLCSKLNVKPDQALYVSDTLETGVLRTNKSGLISIRLI
jgi:FMN phosphatase YigB (HAD superfamily)